MNKVLAGLFVPAIQERFDLLLPCDLEIAALTDVISDCVKELSEGRYQESALKMLAIRNPDPSLFPDKTLAGGGLLLRPDKTLADYGADDGLQLALF